MLLVCFDKKKKKNLRYDKRKENSNSTILENTIRELQLSLARYFSYFISIDLCRLPCFSKSQTAERVSEFATAWVVSCCQKFTQKIVLSQKIKDLRLLCIDRFISIYSLVSFFLIFQIPTLWNVHPNLALRQQSSLHKFD